MKLLSRSEAQSQIKKRNDTLVEESVRLQGIRRKEEIRLSQAKADYSPEKAEALRDFEAFSDGIAEKKSKLLRELKTVDTAVNDKKELYYGLVEQMDVLIEREHAVNEREKKVDLRERFVQELEKKLYAK